MGLLTASGNEVIALPPQPGQAQLWSVMAALAPAQPTTWSLAELLRRNMSALGRRHTLIVITPAATAPARSGAEQGQVVGVAPLPAPMPNTLEGGNGYNAESGAGDGTGDWIPQLVQAQRVGLASSVLLVAMPEDESEAAELVRRLIALDVPAQVLRTDMPLRAALTYRRKRKIIRSTPTGGAYTVEVEEEVG